MGNILQSNKALIILYEEFSTIQIYRPTQKDVKSNKVKIFLYVKKIQMLQVNTLKAIKSYSNHHGKVRAKGLLFSKENTQLWK